MHREPGGEHGEREPAVAPVGVLHQQEHHGRQVEQRGLLASAPPPPGRPPLAAAPRTLRRGEAAKKNEAISQGVTTLSSSAARVKYTASGLSAKISTASTRPMRPKPSRVASPYSRAMETSLQTNMNSRAAPTAYGARSNPWVIHVHSAICIQPSGGCAYQYV